MKPEDYTHRIGRTGRAGRNGLAITFAEWRDQRRMHAIEQHTRQPLQAEVIPGLEPRSRPKAPARPHKHAHAGRPAPRKGGARNQAERSGGYARSHADHSARPAPGRNKPRAQQRPARHAAPQKTGAYSRHA